MNTNRIRTDTTESEKPYCFGDEVEVEAAREEQDVPADVMLVSEAAERAGVVEQKVRDRALTMNEVARLHKLGDGRWVVSKVWAEARLGKVEA